jgi:hypothetical protein
MDFASGSVKSDVHTAAKAMTTNSDPGKSTARTTRAAGARELLNAARGGDRGARRLGRRAGCWRGSIE